MMKRLLFFNFFLILFFIGCVIPESNHVEPEYHLLTSVTLDDNMTFRIPEVSFHVREVNLPPYLDDNRLVQRKNRTSIDYLENHRWGEPLGEGISRVIGLNLSTNFDSIAYSYYPNRSRQDVIFEISISIIQLERVDSSNVVVNAMIEIFHKNNLQAQLKIKDIIPIADNEMSSGIMALSACISKVSNLIAEQIYKLPASQCLLVKSDYFESDEESLEVLLSKLSSELLDKSTTDFLDQDIVRISEDFGLTEYPLVSLRAKNTSLYEIIKLISRKSGFPVKFTRTGIVFYSVP